MKHIALAGLAALIAIGAVLTAQSTADDMPLNEAVAENDVEAVQDLLLRGADVNAPDESGITPLMAAAGTANASMTQLLLQQGARPDDSTDNGVTALVYAASAFANSADVEATVRTLLDAGADPNPRTSTTPLVMALKQDHAGAVVLLQERGAVKANAVSHAALLAEQKLMRTVKSVLIQLTDPEDLPEDKYIGLMVDAWETYEADLLAVGFNPSEEMNDDFTGAYKTIFQRNLLDRRGEQ